MFQGTQIVGQASVSLSASSCWQATLGSERDLFSSTGRFSPSPTKKERRRRRYCCVLKLYPYHMGTHCKDMFFLSFWLYMFFYEVGKVHLYSSIVDQKLSKVNICYELWRNYLAFKSYFGCKIKKIIGNTTSLLKVICWYSI